MNNDLIQLIDTMGSDLSVVNDARVSFDKQSTWEIVGPFETWLDAENARRADPNARPIACDGLYYERVSDADAKLIAYLAKNAHFSPFTHIIAKFRIKQPLALARQWYKHRIGLEKDCGWNEVSRRYVDDTPEFFMPEGWRARADKVKQGSAAEFVANNDEVTARVLKHNQDSADLYNWMLDQGVAPELARMPMPVSTYTAWVETGSVMAYARLVGLRDDPHAQLDIQPYAQAVATLLSERFPSLLESAHIMNSVYLAGPITGCSYNEATDWRNNFGIALKAAGIKPLSPMRGAECLSELADIQGHGEEYAHMNVFSKGRAIMARDRFDATRCDVLLVNLLGATRVSIGTVMEIAWAELKRIPIVVAIEPSGNPHEHCMVNEAIDFRVTSLGDALEVVKGILV